MEASAGIKRRVADEAVDYWFDIWEDGGVKHCVTYAYGLEIDRRDNAADTGKSYTDLMREALPAVQNDVDLYGVA